MTPYIDSNMPLSKMTVAALEDMGFIVNYYSTKITYSGGGLPISSGIVTGETVTSEIVTRSERRKCNGLLVKKKGF